MTLSIPVETSAGTGAMIELCDVADVAAEQGLKVDLPGFAPLAVFVHQGQYYVTDDTCTHGAASLCEGEVFGDEVECPFHQGAFNFRTGAATARPCTLPIKTYSVELCGTKVCIRMEPVP
jgi:nitrite reductase/ring-hydroxylating ferredoxin subunit